MRLQLITHSYLPERTPPQRRWTAFVEAFREAGWDVDIVVPAADPGHVPGGPTPDSPAGTAPSMYRHRGPRGERLLRTPRLPVLGGSRDRRFLGHIVHAVAAIPVSLRADRPDVLVITVPALPTVVAGWAVSRVRRVPLIVEMRDAWPDLARESGVSTSALSRLMETLVTGTQRAADLVVTVTEGFAARLAERGIAPLAVVGNGVPLAEIETVAPREREPGELHVLYLGNHGESQGLETIIRAAALVRDGDGRITVRLVGSGTRKDELAALNDSLGAPVTLLDPVHGAELRAQYAWADTCLVTLRPDWPSFGWTVPSKTYELLAVGRHITGVVTGEAAQILAESTAADLVAPDPEAVAEHWRALAADPASTAIGSRGRDWVAAHADLPGLGRTMVGLAASVAAGTPVPGTGPHDATATAAGAGPAPEPGTPSSDPGLPAARSRTGRVRQLGANLALTATTVSDHVRDDPAVLALQMSRRLPARLRRSVSAAAARLDRGPTQVAGAIGLAAAGRTEELRGRAEAALERGAPDRRLVHYADVLTSTGDTGTAARLLDRARPGTTGREAALARLAWHEGRMDESIEVLPTTGREGRQRQRLETERASFTGTRPRLEPVADYRPRPGAVLHVLNNSLPHTGSGYAQRTHAILAALRAEGWDVAAVTRLGWPVQTGILHAAPVDTVDGIDYHRLLPTRLAPGFDARLQQHAALLLDLVRTLRPALLHTTTHFTNALVVQAVAEAVGIPWVYEVRGQLADTWASTRGPEARDSQRYRLFTAREAEAARAADAVVTLGRAMRDNLAAQGVDPAGVELCPNAVGGPFLREPGDRAAARRRLGLDPEAAYVGTVSSIVPYEGLDTLVRAVARLAPSRPELRLLLVGDGTALPGLLELAERMGIADRVVATGRVDRALAPDYHQSLDVFVVPRQDTSVTRSVTPMKSVEASASARPVVASDLPALAELVDHGVTGLLFHPEDPEDLARSLESLLADPARADDMGRAGRRWALAERTWAANAAKYGRLYRSLLPVGHRPVSAPGL
jgi:glycosyltransferase involved in cell wall biosynthesis